MCPREVSILSFYNQAQTPIIVDVYVLNSFSVIVKCWALDPEDRPTFEKLSTTLGKLLQIAGGYMELSMVLLPPEDSEDEQG